MIRYFQSHYIGARFNVYFCWLERICVTAKMLLSCISLHIACDRNHVYSNHSVCQSTCDQPFPDPSCLFTYQGGCICANGTYYHPDIQTCVDRDVCDYCILDNKAHRVGVSYYRVIGWVFLIIVSQGGCFLLSCHRVGVSYYRVIGWVFLIIVSQGGCFLLSCHRVGVSYYRVIGWVFLIVVSQGGCFLISCHMVGVSYYRVIGWVFLIIVSQGGCFLLSCHRVGVSYYRVIGWVFLIIVSQGGCFLLSCHRVGVS